MSEPLENVLLLETSVSAPTGLLRCLSCKNGLSLNESREEHKLKEGSGDKMLEGQVSQQ